MARYYKPITRQQLETLIDAQLVRYDTFPSLCHEGKLASDLAKVSFDFENYDYEQAETQSYWLDQFTGYKSIGDFDFLMAHAGGDWEHSVVFIIYWDGDHLRGYVPKDGNCWNHKTKEAFGNNDEADEKFIRKFMECYDHNGWEELIDQMYNYDKML